MNKQTIIWILAAANVALVATLGVRGMRPNAANAQAVAGRTESGKYIMIPGVSQQLGVAIVYFIDVENRRIGAIAPDARDNINVMPPLALDPIFDAFTNGGGGPRVNPEAQRNAPAGAVRPRSQPQPSR